MTSQLVIKNRPLEHYILVVFSKILNDGEITLKGQGSLISKTVDIANIITDNFLPGELSKKFEDIVEYVQVDSKKHKVSTVIIKLTKK